MRIEDLLPWCSNPKCGDGPAAAGPHKHLLPAQREVLESDAKYIATVGGYGSGKSLGVGMLEYVLLSQVPGNRGIVIRRTYPKLHDTEQRMFFEILERSGADWKGYEKRDGWYHRIVLPNLSELFFRESKDLGRFLGPEYGFFHIGEGIEEPEATFTALQGRLRLPAARRYLKGIVSTNPPSRRHWVSRIFGPEPGIIVAKDEEGITTKYHRIWSPTRENPNLPASYIADLKRSLPPSEVQRVLEGKTTFQFEGKGVYSKKFQWHRHVVPALEPKKNSDGTIWPMHRSWDFGFHCPAVGWHQFYKCYHGKTHWMILRETDCRDLYDEDLCAIVKSVSRDEFPKCLGWTDIGDAAGAKPSTGGPGPIVRLMRPPYTIKFHYKKMPSLDPGIALVESVLSAPDCPPPCGQPILMIHPSCQFTVEMFSGGYHYTKEKYDRETSAKPVKDGLYDNYADMVRYEAEIGYRLESLDHAMLDRMLAYKRPQDQWKLPSGETIVEFPYPDRMRLHDEVEAKKQRENFASFRAGN